MDSIEIVGGIPLHGEVRVSGAKNAVLPMMAASLLTRETCRLTNVPNLKDVDTMCMILRQLGVRVERVQPQTIELEVLDESPVLAPYSLVSQMRASICVLGPLLARRGRARVAMPGGCVIGTRPIDLHLKGLRALGRDQCAKAARNGGIPGRSSGVDRSRHLQRLVRGGAGRGGDRHRERRL